MPAVLTCLRPVHANGRKYAAGDAFDPSGLTDAQVARLVEVGAVGAAQVEAASTSAPASPVAPVESELARLNAEVADEPVRPEVRRSQPEMAAPAASEPEAASVAPEGDDSQEPAAEPEAAPQAPAPPARGRGRRR